MKRRGNIFNGDDDSDMSFEHGSESPAVVPFGESQDWGWPDGEELTPIVKDLLTGLEQGLEVPSSKSQPPIGEIVENLRKQAEAMGVEDPQRLSKSKVRQYPALFLEQAHVHGEDSYVAYNVHAFEDVHYVAYKGLKDRAQRRFVSVTTKDIFQAVPETIPEIAALQASQTIEAYSYLVDRGINHRELSRMLNGGDQEERFAMRSLARLLPERSMYEYVDRLIREEKEEHSDTRFDFQEVAKRGLKIMTWKRREHQELLKKMRSFSTDTRVEMLLEWRAIKRAYSFARPIASLIKPDPPE